MGRSTANRLTLWGFCLIYVGLMAFLGSLDMPVLSGFRQLVFYTVGVLGVAGVVVLLMGRLAKAEEWQPSNAPRI